MGIEIERKFTVVGAAWRGDHPVLDIRQAYLSLDPDRTVRVRVTAEAAFLTVKGRGDGARRREVEVALPRADGLELLPMALGAPIEKRRHLIEHGGFRYEVDEFTGANAGLVIAELEVDDEAAFARALAQPPAWLGADVTADTRLLNACLAERPFSTWPVAEQAAYRAG